MTSLFATLHHICVTHSHWLHMDLFAITLYSRDPGSGRLLLHAMPVMITVLCCLAIAFRYYSAFLAAKVAAFDDTRVTPAHRLNDGQNYHPTNRWVLFGHHFAAISGAGPLIGPVLAIQYGFAPGLVWLVIGVCLAGAVQDMLVMAASVRRDGKSIAEIARHELGYAAAIVASVAILFIVVIALAGLGFVVVKALGGEEVKMVSGTRVILPQAGESAKELENTDKGVVLEFPPGCALLHEPTSKQRTMRSESFRVRCPQPPIVGRGAVRALPDRPPGFPIVEQEMPAVYVLPAGSTQLVPGSSWGTFTIACTIPIALLVGLWMYRIRPGRVVEASLIGGVLTLVAVVIGEPVSRSALGAYFSLTRDQTIIALGTYGFIAAVLPVWLLLGPRDYLSSFLKIGTIGLLVVSVCVANPALQAPPLNEVFINGGPTFPGQIFPFVFICIMCGSISGFHSLVSSGTTPKMVEKESHIRTIGYGSMLMEGIVGVTALIAAASLPSELYYAINVPIDREPEFKQRLDDVYDKYGVKMPPEANDPAHATNVSSPQHLDLGKVEEKVGGESLRGRTGGAVTLAVGMSVIFEQAFDWFGVRGEWMLKYWYHFAIMFEALFILTTIDAGTRIARFLLQESVGRVYAPMAKQDWLPGAIFASAVVTAGWVGLVWTGSIDTIWPMFGIANQLLAVMALAIVTTWLVNTGRSRYSPVTILPMLFVCSTTLTAAVTVVKIQASKNTTVGTLNAGLTIFVIACVVTLLFWSVSRWLTVWFKLGQPNGPAKPNGGA